jgi:O-antigen/teichoic acid export membrane protein
MTIAKRVVGGTGIITLAGVTARALGLATVPILTPLLGPEPYGVAALVMTVLALATMLAMLGVDMSYARFYLQEAESERDSVERFCWRFAVTGSVALGLVIAGGWAWFGRRVGEQGALLGAFSAVALVLAVAIPMMTTRVRLHANYRRVAASVIGGAFASAVIMIVLALTWRRDVWVLLWGTLGSSIVALLILGLPPRGVLLTPSGLPRNTRNAVLSLGVSGAITAPAHWLISSADRWFLAIYRDPVEIGIYAMALNIAAVGLVLNSSMTLTWFPEASRLYGEQGDAALATLGELWSRLAVAIAVVWLMVTASGGDMLRLLAAPSFHPGADYIPWLAAGVFFHGMGALATTSIFLAGKMRFTAYVWIAGGAFSMVLNLLLVPTLGALGAAIVQCITLAVIAGAMFAVAQRLLRLPIATLRLATTTLMIAVAGFVMAPPWLDTPILSLLVKFPVGVIIAAAALRISAPDWFARALLLLRRKSTVLSGGV